MEQATNKRKYVNYYVKKGRVQHPLVLVNKNTLETKDFSGPRELFNYLIEIDHLPKTHPHSVFKNAFDSAIRTGRKVYGLLVFKKEGYTEEKALALLNYRKNVGKKGQIKTRSLSAEIVMNIISEPKHLLHKEIAEKYGTTRQIVNKILIGASYSDITGIKWTPRYNMNR